MRASLMLSSFVLLVVGCGSETGESDEVNLDPPTEAEIAGLKLRDPFRGEVSGRICNQHTGINSGIEIEFEVLPGPRPDVDALSDPGPFVIVVLADDDGSFVADLPAGIAVTRFRQGDSMQHTELIEVRAEAVTVYDGCSE